MRRVPLQTKHRRVCPPRFPTGPRLIPGRGLIAHNWRICDVFVLDAEARSIASSPWCVHSSGLAPNQVLPWAWMRCTFRLRRSGLCLVFLRTTYVRVVADLDRSRPWVVTRTHRRVLHSSAAPPVWPFRSPPHVSPGLRSMATSRRGLLI